MKKLDGNILNAPFFIPFLIAFILLAYLGLTSIKLPSRTPNLPGYPKILFNQKAKFFQDTNYPSQFANVSQNSLIGLKCAPATSYDQKNPDKLFDAVLAGTHQDQYGHAIDVWNVTSFQKCDAANGSRIVLFTVLADDWVEFFDVGIVADDKTIRPLVYIRNNNNESKCFNPMYYTNDKKLYFQCNHHSPVEDGSKILEANLSSGTMKVVYACSDNAKYGVRCPEE